MIMENPSDLWRKRTFLFMTSQAISLFGSSLVSYAILWRITLDTQSGFMMTLYLLFGFLPTFFMSPFAGVWADRYLAMNKALLKAGEPAAPGHAERQIIQTGRRWPECPVGKMDCLI
jgi:DHA3 family macrolide efflux protein-like MFS transporter